MKALPEAVQRAFPCAPDRLSERPWWRRQGPGLGWVRLDGSKVDAPTPSYMEFADGVRPLPHPGFRAGQVWAAEDGESTTIMRSTSTRVWVCDDEPPPEFTRGYPYLMADPACPHLAPWAPATSKETTE